jgi:peptidyl-prolyl cis-trans isomerase B (cyclophilin B)
MMLMTPATRPALLLVLASALVLGACDPPATETGAGDPGAGGPAANAIATALPEGGAISVTVEAPTEALELGDAIPLKVVVRNDSDAETRVNVPRLDRSCATVRVRAKGGEPYVLERLYADVTAKGLEWKVPVAKMLGPGESLTGEFSLTATQVGELHMTVQYRHSVTSTEPVTATPFTVNVTPKDGKSDLGVRLDTSMGAMTVKLRPDVAPNTVQSFATLVREGLFNGLTFHRIVAKFMAQGGDPKGDGSGGPGYFLPLETQRDLLHDRGVLSMARTGIPDTAGSQFFLMFARRPDLDPRGPGTGYTTFGEMVDGDATLTKLEGVETKIPDKILEEVKRRGIPQEQVELLIRRGSIEKSTPVTPVTIKTATLIGLD